MAKRSKYSGFCLLSEAARKFAHELNYISLDAAVGHVAVCHIRFRMAFLGKVYGFLGS